METRSAGPRYKYHSQRMRGAEPAAFSPLSQVRKRGAITLLVPLQSSLVHRDNKVQLVPILTIS